VDPWGYAEHTQGTAALRRSGNGVGWCLPGMPAGTLTFLSFSWFSLFLQQVLSLPLPSKYFTVRQSHCDFKLCSLLMDGAFK
jgi:hypothetical protein